MAASNILISISETDGAGPVLNQYLLQQGLDQICILLADSGAQLFKDRFII